jgi:hypothetical protein
MQDREPTIVTCSCSKGAQSLRCPPPQFPICAESQAFDLSFSLKFAPIHIPATKRRGWTRSNSMALRETTFHRCSTEAQWPWLHSAQSTLASALLSLGVGHKLLTAYLLLPAGGDPQLAGGLGRIKTLLLPAPDRWLYSKERKRHARFKGLEVGK